jgi:membrane-bound lytic murein transglycosylase MltF
VRNNANGNEILEFKVEPHGMSYDLSKSFTAQAGVVYKIEIEANDLSGVESEREFTVSVN